jgi:K+-transporting ATPase ATPase A chain
VVILHVPLGNYLARVYSATTDWGIEKAIYRIVGVQPDDRQRWTKYLSSLLAFSSVSALFLYTILLLHVHLPEPWGHKGMTPALAFNTAISFTTNTSWPNYPGESTLGHFVLAAGLGVQAFASCAVGMCVAVALIRGLAQYQSLEVAGWESIKLMSGDGGGAFNANSAHPFENPTPLTNVVEIVAMLLIPVAFLRTFGVMVGDKKQGWALFAAAAVLFVVGMGAMAAATSLPHGTVVHAVGAPTEGTETRFGVPGSALFGQVATASADGAANSSYDSFASLGGAVLLINMMLGEVAPGGAGSGLYGLVMMVLLGYFSVA